MEKKINIAELLKDCPIGMELDCTMFDNVYLERVDKNVEYPIVIRVGKTDFKHLTKYGCWNKYSNAKCVIFPKGKTTWEGFQRPFKDGDVIYFITKNNNEYITIFKNDEDVYLNTYIDIANTSTRCSLESSFDIDNIKEQRFATEEEKQKLFNAIKENDYKWDDETKTLEKLLKFKIGDKVKHKLSFVPGIIIKADDKGYNIEYPNGDGIAYVSITLEDDFELAPNKFDINTLIPFESKVLVRYTDHCEWESAVFGRYDGNNFFTIGGTDWKYCIPYEGNEHLFGTTNDCSEFFKIWEK